MKRFLLCILILLLSSPLYAGDSKTTDLPALTDVVDADIMYIVDDVSGTPTSKKITVIDVFDTIDTSTKLSTIITDETGTGAVVFGTSPTFTTGIEVTDILEVKASGVTVSNNDFAVSDGEIAVGTSTLGSILAGSGSGGVLTLGGTGGSNNEVLSFDFESTPDNVLISSVGVNSVRWVNMAFQLDDDLQFILGDGYDSRMAWETTGNDNLQIGTNVGSADASGYISIMERVDMGTANRSPLATSANPVLRVYSSDATQPLDYIEMYHDQTDAHVASGSGDIHFTSAGGDAIFLSGNVGIGTVDPETALEIDTGATPSSSQLLTSANSLGALSLLTYSTDNSYIMFDALWDGTIDSRDAGSNFGIHKEHDRLDFVYDSSVPVGDTVTFNVGMTMDTSGRIGIGATTPDEDLHVIGGICVESSDLACPGGIDSGTIAGDVFSDQRTYELAGQFLDVLTAPKLLLGWLTPSDAGTEQDLTKENHDATYFGTADFTTGDQLHKGFVWSLDFDGSDDKVVVADHADFSFNGTTDVAFSVGGWFEIIDNANTKVLVGKWDDTGGSEDREWLIVLDTAEKVDFYLGDEASNKISNRKQNTGMSAGWHFIVATYDGGGGATAVTGITLYVDGLSVASTASNDAGYVDMVAGNTDVTIGAYKNSSLPFAGDVGMVFITTEELTAANIWKLYVKSRGYYNL